VVSRRRRVFSGKKRAYTADAPVEALATHGLVVDRLAALLKARDPHNDRHRDLYLGNGTAPTHLFEVKTDLTSTSIYAGASDGSRAQGRPAVVQTLAGALLSSFAHVGSSRTRRRP
jgi:hypothetical protein